MNYKIIKFNCGCKYIFITDSEKQILKENKFCPDHPKMLKKHVVLFCQDCGLKMTETGLLSWQRKMRCNECKMIDQRKRTKENWDKKSVEYNTKRRKPVKKVNGEHYNIALETARKRLALKRFYKSISIVLPVAETPILDRLQGGSQCLKTKAL